MRVCIPIPFKPEGGGQYFLESFRQYLTANDHQVVSNVDDRYDVLFTNHWVVPLAAILRALRHNPGARIVQRIDGVAADYGRGGNADRRQGLVNRFADVTIFQSEYSKWAARVKYRVIDHDGPVIHNPVDVDRFRPDGPSRTLPEPVRVACVSWSVNPMKGAADVYAVAAANPDVGFYLCGRYESVPQRSNIHHLGVLERGPLSDVLRSCDVLLTFSRSEACPNHVLEALASGRPVLFADSGAMAEVVGPCGIAIERSSFRAALDRVMRDWPHWSAAARARAVEMFHPDRVFPKYIDTIRSAVDRPVVGGRAARSLLPMAWPLLLPFRRWGWA